MYHRELERTWWFDTTWWSPFQQNYEDLSHTIWYTFGDCSWLAGGMTEKEITSLCYLSTFAWIFPTFSAVHFLAFAYLAITFWSKKCVIIGIEGLMSSGSVTNVTGTLFRMRSTFCWTVRMNILLAHSTASWSSHLNMKIAQLVWELFWTNLIFMVWPNLWLSALFPWFFLGSFWFGFRLFPSFCSDAPQRHI
jgi:hypothetical protein